ncbi:hypothetical protein AB4Y32_24520 [Paraburkholderia phymatum]|uniref:Uncharacterized protein n=1 Tax=Paraburkholderia phymatum TaxID=148447 RepID=A0ACC6U5T9_9BURK
MPNLVIDTSIAASLGLDNKSNNGENLEAATAFKAAKKLRKNLAARVCVLKAAIFSTIE